MQGQLRIITLMASLEGRYDFEDTNLNRVVSVVPTDFKTWLQRAWAGQFTPL